MSSRLPKSRRSGKRMESVKKFFGLGGRRKDPVRKARHLVIDSLEQRQLLSLSVGTLGDVMVNQVFAGSQSTIAGQSMATDHNGDSVVVWTRLDQVVDPSTGNLVSDQNIYARYLTDEVQRVILPAAAVQGTGNISGRFSLIYSADEIVQTLTFSSTTPPSNAPLDDIRGLFKLSIDLNNDRIIDSYTETTDPIAYDESQWNSTNPALNPATLIKNALLKLVERGGDVNSVFANLDVKAIDSRNFSINFAGVAPGSDQPLVQVVQPVTFSSGFLPALTISTERRPSLVGVTSSGIPNIYVSPTDPSKTALSIEAAFQTTASSYPQSPVIVNQPQDTGVTIFSTPVAKVKVAPVKTADDPNGLRTFDITFVDGSGKQWQPLLKFAALQDASGNDIMPTDAGVIQNMVRITKMSSAEFRVNPPEPDDPFTPWLDVVQQSSPAVAMDADGDFVIAWQSTSSTPQSTSDIFARRYTPAKMIDDSWLVISESNLTVPETGSKSFKVSLSAKPISNVTVTITREAGSDTDLTIDSTPLTLTFTPSNWNTPQEVTVHAAADADSTNGTAYFDVSANGFETRTVTASELDINAIIVSTNNLTVGEQSANLLSVRLATKPASGTTVTVNITPQAGGDADLSITSTVPLTFTDADWDKPKTVTFAAAADTDTLNGTAAFEVAATGYGSQFVIVKEQDNSKRIVLSTDYLSVIEGSDINGLSNTFTVQLAGQPTERVRLKVVRQTGDSIFISSDLTDLSFTPTNWNVPQTVTINSTSDSNTTNEKVTFHIYCTTDPEYLAQSVVVTQIDAPRPFILSIDPNDYLFVNENGSQNFTLQLRAQPETNVTVTIRPDTAAAPGFDPNITSAQTTLTFTPTNWNTPQTVTINAAEDTATTDGARRFFLSAPGYGTQLVNVVKLNNDPYQDPKLPDPPPDPLPKPLPNFIITSSSIYVPEGGTNSISITLANKPEGDKTVYVWPQAGGDADITWTPNSPIELIFSEKQTLDNGQPNPNYYLTPRIITFSAAQDDDIANGSVTFDIYDKEDDYARRTVVVYEADDDMILDQSIAVSVNDLSVVEGKTNTFTVRLQNQPAANVTVYVTRQLNSDPSLTISGAAPLALTFTTANWNTPQTVTMAAAEDADTINGKAYVYIIADGYAPRGIEVTEVDNDISPVVFSTTETNLNVAEGGEKSFTMKLAVRPVKDVTVTVAKTTGDDGDLTARPLTFTFTPDNWNQPQTFTVLADEDVDFTNGTATFRFSSVDAGGTTYLPVKTISATEVDNDVLQIEISTDLLPILEGGRRIFQVRLPAGAQPTGNVRLNITQLSGDGTIKLEPAYLTFTPSNYNNWQTIAVYAANDPNSVNETADFRLSADGYLSKTVSITSREKSQAVRELGNAFQVNTFTVDAQTQPSVTMDMDGNFAITWSNEGQDISFFNGIAAQRFNRDGDRVGNEFMVNTEDTNNHGNSFASLSPDGQYLLVTWMMGPGAIEPGALEAIIFNAKESDTQGYPTVRFQQTVLVNGVASPTAAWDSINDFIITWDQPAGQPNADIDYLSNPGDPATFSAGVYGAMWDINGNRLRNLRANSGNVTGANTNLMWPNDQRQNQAAVDADGDLTIVYSGFGPDVSQNLMVLANWFGEALQADPEVSSYFPGALPNPLLFPFNSDEADGLLDNVLWTLQNAGANDSILGRVRAIYDIEVAKLRGEANGILFTQYDADPVLGPQNVLVSDGIVNAQRDGNNERAIIAIGRQVNGGNFTVSGSFGTLTINPVFYPTDPPTLNIGATATAIDDALESVLGLSWPETRYEGTVEVRIINAQEFQDRQGMNNGQTAWWDLSQLPTVNDGIDPNMPLDPVTQVLYEVTFQGESHDSGVGLQLASNNLLRKVGDNYIHYEIMFTATETSASAGTVQNQPSIGMQPNGSFGVAWTQNNLTTTGNPAGQNIYYRNFKESTDTAGPMATDVILSDGTRLPSTRQITVLNNNVDMHYAVVTFDESMALSGTGSVLNPANWSLTKDGQSLSGGISKIAFGMNAASEILPATLGYQSSNKYEAVIFFDGNGSTTGTPSLGNGNYTLTALNSLRDASASGNPLLRTGFLPNGASQAWSFSVANLTDSETQINSTTTGDQTKQNRPAVAGNDITAPSSPHAVANDGNGDYVAVWTTQGKSLNLNFQGSPAGTYQLYWNAETTNPITLSGSTLTAADAANVEIALKQKGANVTATLADSTTISITFLDTISAQPISVLTSPGFSGQIVTSTPDGGVWAKLYKTTWNATTHKSDITVTKVIQVSSNLSDTYASVAMDGDGDFVVTWSRDDSVNDPTGDTNPSWNIYAKRFDAKGTIQSMIEKGVLKFDEVLVNTSIEDIQCFSDVAMDVDGDFMVTWQSNAQDESGYGVYMQRYSPSGVPLGGINEKQTLSFVGSPTGSFRLGIDLDGDGDISESEKTAAAPNKLVYDGDTAAIAGQVEAALLAIGADVRVTATTTTDLQIEFVGTMANRNMPQIAVFDPELTGFPGKQISVSSSTEGVQSEFRVNDTTANDQMYPSVAANEKGEFIVTWTSFGQNGDAVWQSNIYAKTYQPNELFRGSKDSPGLSVSSGNTPANAKLTCTTVDATANHTVAPTAGFTGVAMITAGPNQGSAVLLSDGIHLLTAAHVVCTTNTNQVIGNITVTFVLPTGNVTIAAKNVVVHPNFDGNPYMSPDLAVITLATPAPSGVTGYELYTASDEIGKDYDFYGFGETGLGATGAATGTYGTLHHGRNTWEGDGTVYNSPQINVPNTLISDFDDGTQQRNALQNDDGVPSSLGLGNDEACITPGDSGGPAFINGKIAGISSAIIGWSSAIDMNSTFGDEIFSVRVSAFANWIEASIGGINDGGSAEFLINQTTTDQQKWSSVALDSTGDFVITWTSYGQDGTGNGPGTGVNGMNGVYARRFNSSNAAVSNEFKVNTFGAFNQQRSQVAMTPSGDFNIVWESFQDISAVDPTGSTSGLPTSYGIYAQRYSAQTTGTGLGPNGEIGSEFRLNTTTNGNQRYPSVALDATGDMIAVWSGNGEQSGNVDSQGIFLQRFNKPSDTAGPYITDVLNVGTSSNTTIYDGTKLSKNVSKFIVVLDENVVVSGINGIRTLDNWTLTKDGVALPGGIAAVDYAFNTVTNKYEATVTFDSNADEANYQSLGQGTYVLTLNDKVRDLAPTGNSLDGNYDGVNGGNFVFDFSVDTLGQGGTTDNTVGDDSDIGGTHLANGHTFPETPGAVAVDADGQHIVAWTAYDSDTNRDRVYFRIFDTDGSPADLPGLGTDSAAVTPVTPAEFMTSHQRYASVACSADGNFVITWTNVANDGSTDVYARRYNSLGQALGDAFRVNNYTKGNQQWSNVAMDSDGDFVVTWSSYGQAGAGKGYDIYAIRYNSAGQVDVPEYLVNVATNGDQLHSNVALTDDGWTVIVYEADHGDGFDHFIFYRVINPEGMPTQYDDGVVFTQDPLARGDHRYPDIATTPDGDSFVIACQYSSKDASGWNINAITATLDREPTQTNGTVPSLPQLTFGNPFEVNSTKTGDQKYPSVAMDYNGAFTVAWSGFGNQTGQADLSGDGVFYQRYNADGSKNGGEKRANSATTGNQYIPSIACDAQGNAVIVFTGPNSNNTGTDLYKTLTAPTAPRVDNVGGRVTKSYLADGTPFPDGGFISAAAMASASNPPKVVVAFTEDMYMGTGSTDPNSIVNKSNWNLRFNGNEVINGILNVSFAYNPQRRSYEATITLNGGGINGGASTALVPGVYQLGISNNLLDKAVIGNRLYVTNYIPNGGSFGLQFTVTEGSLTGNEILIDTNTQYRQVLGRTLFGSTNNSRESTRAVAIDHSGNFAVTWTSYGQDDQSDANGGGVYMRLYDRNSNPLTPETRVNSFTQGMQRGASIAMDADGDFVITWESQAEDADGSWGIYAQRFNSLGKAMGGEIRVVSNYFGDQIASSVAMNAYGNFIVVWATRGASWSYFNDIHAQIFNSSGNKVGNEFRVNSANLPGDGGATGGNEVNPIVAMDDNGNFVVAWEQNYVNNLGVALDTYIVARMFDSSGTPRNYTVADDGNGNTVTSNLEFRVDASGLGNDFISNAEHLGHQQPVDINGVASPNEYRKTARNPTIAMDRDGNFTIAWESFEDNDLCVIPPASDYSTRENADSADSYGIYFRRFAANGTPMTSGDHQANFVYSAATTNDPFSGFFSGDQLNAAIGIDGNNALTVAWSGNGSNSEPGRYFWSTQYDPNGIFTQNYSSSSYTPNIEGTSLGGQSRVNTTNYGVQDFPSLAMQPDGSYVIVWSGNGVGDSNGVFARRYLSTLDKVGPMVTDFSTPNGSQVVGTTQVASGMSAVIIHFDEALATSGVGSVYDANNYRILKNNVTLANSVYKIYYGLNDTNLGLGNLKDANGNPLSAALQTQYGLTETKTNKYEVIIVVDANGGGAGTPAMTDGLWRFAVMNTLRDKSGNLLGSTGVNENGEILSGFFQFALPSGQETAISTGTSGGKYTNPSAQSIASDANGNQAVVWSDSTPGQTGVYVKLLDCVWTVNNGVRTSSMTQKVDGSGNLVPIIRVTSDPTATNAAIARDLDGDFVVTWSVSSNSTDYDVYARRYSSNGTALGEAFRVNTYTAGTQRYSAVAMDAQGDFVITWQSLDQKTDNSATNDDSGYGVYAQRYSPEGARVGGIDEIQSINFINGWTGTFRLAFDLPTGGTVVTESISYNGNGAATAYAIQNELKRLGVDTEVSSQGTKISIRFVNAYAELPLNQIRCQNIVRNGGSSAARIEISVFAPGDTGEFRVNDTISGDQCQPSIAMDESGNFVISWTSYGQDGDGLARGNIYAKKFPRNAVYEGTYGEIVTSPTSPGSLGTAIPLISSLDDLGNHVVPTGTGYDGVVQIFMLDPTTGDRMGSGSGALIAGTNFILTAAHVVTLDGTNVTLPGNDYEIVFNTPTGQVVYHAASVYVMPGWDWDLSKGLDLALIQLGVDSGGNGPNRVGLPPIGVEGYELYRGTDEVTQTFDVHGYGTTGDPLNGETNEQDGIQRWGRNRYDATGGVIGWSDSLLVMDFDDGTTTHDTLGRVFGIHNLGEGYNEVGMNHGDSGGPQFIDGKISGVNDFVLSTYPGGQSASNNFGTAGSVEGAVRVSSFLDWIDYYTLNSSAEFMVNENTIVNVQIVGGNLVPVFGADNQTDDQKWSSVAMDANGDFVISWTSYGHDTGANDPNNLGKNGIYARRFNSQAQMRTLIVGGVPQELGMSFAAADVFQVNTFTEGNQQHSKVAMDADGDFVVAYESFQDQLDSSFSYGVYARRYASTSAVNFVPMQLIDPNSTIPFKFVGTNGLYGPDGEIGSELQVNATVAGNQRSPSVAMNSNGDITVAWSGAGVTDSQGVYLRTFNQIKDTTGPMIGNVYSLSGSNLERLADSSIIQTAVSKFVVTFSEAMSTEGGATGAHSILNPNNWMISREGNVLMDGITNVEFAWNASRSKYEATITFDSDQSTAGNQALGIGNYVLTLKDVVYDANNNKLDGDFNGALGSNYLRSFSVYGNGPVAGQTPNISLPTGLTLVGTPSEDDTSVADIVVNSVDSWGRADFGAVSAPVTASNAGGDYVVVWVSKANDTDGDIMAQRYDRFGRALGSEIQVSSYENQASMNGTLGGAQIQPAVAMDDYGNFVVTWSGQGASDLVGVWARFFDTTGAPVSEDFRVNQVTSNRQDSPSVAMDSNGNVVVTWTSTGQDSDANGVFARRFNLLGQPKSDEFLVNSTTKNSQQASCVAMDASGNFTVVWQSDLQDGSSWGIYGQRFNATGTRLGGEFRLNTYGTDKQTNPKIAMDAAGNFMVVWESFGQDGNGWGVFGRRFNSAGVAQETGEFRVNKTTNSWQYEPSISASNDGKFAVVWASIQSDDPDVKDYGVFCHIYNSDGSTYVDPNSGLAMDEFRVNIETFGNQVSPTVSMDADGDLIVAWIGPDPIVPQTVPPTASDLMAIFARVMVLNPTSYSTYTPKSASNAFSYISTTTIIGGQTVFSLDGTSANDVFVFYAGSSPAGWTLSVNGVKKAIPTNATGVSIDGGGGFDQLWFYGPNGVFTADVGYEQGIFNFGSYALNYANLDYIAITGASGNDSVTMRDSAGNDAFQAVVGSAKMTNDVGRAIFANSVKNVSAEASAGGYDSAVLLAGSNGNSAYAAGPTGVDFSGIGFNYHVGGFDGVSAYASPGKSNTAVFNHTDGGDILIASSLGAQYIGANFAYDIWNLSSIEGNGAAGDDYRFYGSSGSPTTLYLTSTSVTQSEPKMSIKGSGFSKFASYVWANGNTSATVVGTAAAESLVTSPLGVQLVGDNMDLSAWTYKQINVVGNGGNDTANMYATSNATTFTASGPTATMTNSVNTRTATNFAQVTAHGNAASNAYLTAKSGLTNTFDASTSQASISGAGFKNIAKGFASVTGSATAGNSDVANFADSAGNDYFISSYMGAMMIGLGYDVSAWGFANANATSTGGYDTARFYGSTASADTFTANPTEATQVGANFRGKASNFEQVEAYSGVGSGGKATLTGSAADDVLVTSPTGASLQGNGYRVDAWYYNSVKADGVSGNDVADFYGRTSGNSLVADNVFAEYSGAGFDNRADRFATVRVHGSASSSDSAMLDHALIETGLKETATGATGMNVLRKLWLYDFDDVKKTVKPSQTTPQPVAVDQLMSAFMFE